MGLSYTANSCLYALFRTYRHYKGGLTLRPPSMCQYRAALTLHGWLFIYEWLACGHGWIRQSDGHPPRFSQGCPPDTTHLMDPETQGQAAHLYCLVVGGHLVGDSYLDNSDIRGISCFR